jgi:hypothetical protein
VTRAAGIVVVLLAIVAGGCRDVDGDCAAHFSWDGVEYDGLGYPRQRVEVGPRLRDSVIRGCRDAPAIDVVVFRLGGIDPSVAVAVKSDPSSRQVELWGRPGYIVESPRHPLHGAVYLTADEPDATEGYRCGAPRTMRVRVVGTVVPGAAPLRVAATRASDREFLLRGKAGRYVNVDAQTTITGADRDGIPYVATGERLRIVVRACGSNEPGMEGLRTLVADALRPLAPSR